MTHSLFCRCCLWQNKTNDYSAWLAASINAHAQPALTVAVRPHHHCRCCSLLTCVSHPQNKANDYSAWLAASNNAHAQLEHQLGRIANLELLLRFGANAWRAQVRDAVFFAEWRLSGQPARHLIVVDSCAATLQELILTLRSFLHLQVAFDEGLLKQSEATLQGLRK